MQWARRDGNLGEGHGHDALVHAGCGAGHLQGHDRSAERLRTRCNWTTTLHDLPYKYTQHGAPGDSSYKLADFERLFNGGYDANGAYDAATVFFGDTVTVANSDTLPAVFGSVRAYYDSMSLDRAAGETKGKFQVHAQLINADDGNGYPRWIQLPRIKAYYHEIDDNDLDFEDGVMQQRPLLESMPTRRRRIR